MDFSETIKKRYSTRAYLLDTIEPEKLNAVLEAVRLAPTAANRQPFKLVVIHTQGRKEELSRVYPAPWFTQAPILICICTTAGNAWLRRDRKNYADVDAAIVMDHLILAATDQGLGTCWVAAFDPVAARDILKLPAGVEPIVFTPLGYAADYGGTKSRLPPTELVCYEKWSA
jgi:nitroreductase